MSTVPNPTENLAEVQRTPYAQLGGEARLRELVQRFYDLMEIEPAYMQLRAAHGSDLAAARDKLFMFLSGWLGGPNLYIERYGHPMLRARHMPFAIGPVERDQWLACMDQAMSECQIDPDLRQGLAKSFFQTADWMVNRRG